MEKSTLKMNATPPLAGVLSEEKMNVVDLELLWRATADAADDMLAIIDKDHRIIRANDKLRKRLGWHENAVHFCHEMIHGESCPPEFCRVAKVLESGHTERLTVTEPNLDGRVFEVTYSPVFDAQGGVVQVVHIMKDVTESRRRENTQRATEQALKDMLESVPDGVFILNRQGAVMFANSAGCRIFGRDRDSFINHDYGVPELIGEMQEIPILQVDGTLGVAETRTTITTWNGEFAYLVILRNITEQVRINRELLTAKQHAETVSVAKSEFLSSMSHELRTPLNSILVLSQLLGENTGDRLTEKQVEFARTIFKSGKDLLTIVNDVLDLSKIEAGRMELYPSDFNLRTVIDSLTRAMEPLALARNNRFEVVVTPDVPKRMRTDPQRLEQILRNLLSNAFKFTQDGTVRLIIDVDGAPSDMTSYLTVKVEDSGIGIAEDHLEMIFQSFMQAGGAINRRFPGTGLGLTLSRKFAEALGGTIRVWSRENHGSTFELRIPLIRADSAAPQRPDADPADQLTRATEILVGNDERLMQAFPRLKGRSVLVVDDDMRTVFAISNLLEEYGCTVTWSENGEKAVSALRSGRRIDAILLDIIMPVKNGFETMAEIRADHRFHTIPIIAVTAKAMPGDRELCLRAGASDYISKPVNVETLISRLQHWIEQGDAMNALPSRSPN